MDSAMLNDIAAYWVIAIWFLGAIAATMGAVYVIQAMYWVLYSKFHGWHVITKAMREYRARQDLEG